jgi:very-short-patch-repair endonuclease
MPIELVAPNARPPRGIHTSDYWLPPDEYVEFDGMRVVTRERAAFDIGRRGRVGDAVARLDALGNATRFRVDDVAKLALRHKRARGLRQLTTSLGLYDPGAESPKETWLRLLLIDEGFPRPQTQIPVRGLDGRPLYYLDMGWEDLLIAVEYDGEDHRERSRFGKDLLRSEYVARLGWIHIRVVADHRRADIVRRVRQARESRLR